MMNKEIRFDETCEAKGCGGPVQVPTEDEVAALTQLKKLKGKVRDIKSRLANLPTTEPSPEKDKLEKTLSDLKEEWDAWELKRKEAARIRMVLLGHEKP
jgi:hypothetical protein